MAINAKLIINILNAHRTLFEAASFRIDETKGDPKKNIPDKYQVYSGKYLGPPLTENDLTKEQAQEVYQNLMDAYADIRLQAETLTRRALDGILAE